MVLAPPAGVTDAEVLEAVRRHWASDVDRVVHLAVGWGGYHWRADVGDEPVLFTTLDIPLPRHTAASLEGAYAAAAATARDVDFVWPPLPTHDGRFTVPLSWGTLSVTGWLAGEAPTSSTPRLARMLADLHAVAPPPGAPRWSTLVSPDLGDRLGEKVTDAWPAPHGPAARDLVRGRLGEVARWADEHGRLLAGVDEAAYVVTHGEPGVHNQWLAAGRTWLLDWETLLLAPAERDLATLVNEGVEVDADPALVRLFDLEWRLSEVESFATWLQQPHTDGADERQALAGLRYELERPHFGA